MHRRSPIPNNLEHQLRVDSVTTYLAAHKHNEDTSSNVRVHALFSGELEEVTLLTLSLLLLCDTFFKLFTPVHQRITTPCSSDEPPLALGLR